MSKVKEHFQDKLFKAIKDKNAKLEPKDRRVHMVVVGGALEQAP